MDAIAKELLEAVRRLSTIAQQPDNVKQYGSPGTTADDVNTMHRYRNTIAIPYPMPRRLTAEFSDRN